MKTSIVYSSKTGNTRQLADAIAAALPGNDILYTGTPVGVGPVSINDHITGYMEGRKVLEFDVK